MATAPQLSPQRQAELISALRALTASAQSVIDSWETGDLAGAVDALDFDSAAAAELLEWLDTHA